MPHPINLCKRPFAEEALDGVLAVDEIAVLEDAEHWVVLWLRCSPNRIVTPPAQRRMRLEAAYLGQVFPAACALLMR